MKDELSKYSEVIEHAELKNYNTYHINGKAKYLVLPNSVQDLEKIIKFLKEKNIKYIVLGNGSNIVLNDKEYDGVMIKLSKLDGIEVYPEKEMAYAEAGAMVPKLVQLAVDNSMTGLEFAAGIPGTVGGAIYGNAGAYNACFLDYVTSVTCLDKETYDIVTLDHEEFTYSYRTSSFKEEKKYIILGAKFFLKIGDKQNSLDIMADRKRRRVESQPLEFPSAGSVFRNPDGDFAGRLIESCELKGKRIGGAEVSEKHANFIINVDNATGKDIHDLIMLVHDTVLEKTNVDLVIEQEFVDWE